MGGVLKFEVVFWAYRGIGKNFVQLSDYGFIVVHPAPVEGRTALYW